MTPASSSKFDRLWAGHGPDSYFGSCQVKDRSCCLLSLPLLPTEVWMLRRICLIAGILSTLMTPAVAHDYGVRGHHEQRYGHVHAHRYYYVRRGEGLFGCRHWSPIGWYWTCYFW